MFKSLVVNEGSCILIYYIIISYIALPYFACITPSPLLAPLPFPIDACLHNRGRMVILHFPDILSKNIAGKSKFYVKMVMDVLNLLKNIWIMRESGYFLLNHKTEQIIYTPRYGIIKVSCMVKGLFT